MAYIAQLGIILSISLLGELLHGILPLAIPASVYGLLLMLAGLCTGLIKLHWVEQTGAALLEWLPLLLVPVTVGLMTQWEVLRALLLPLLLVTVVSTVIVMALTGTVTQWIMRRGKGVGDE